MKLTFFSNVMSHHQKPFCEEMYHKLGDDFRFVVMKNIKEERKKLGYSTYEGETIPYLINVSRSKENYDLAKQLATDSDVVIFGSGHPDLLAQRVAQNKLTFLYTERLFKRGRFSLLRPDIRNNLKVRYQMPGKNSNFYMLSASAFTPYDLSLLNCFSEKCYRWGYFPEFLTYEEGALCAKKKHDIPRLLWVGRMIDWKRTIDALKVAKKLQKQGYQFQLDIIGTGVLEDKLKAYTKKNKLENCVTFLGAMPPEKVRNYMEEANIFLFTSTKREGWGAVLNEAMNSGCVCVANSVIGSAPYLVEDGKNGLLYSGISDFYQKVKFLLDHPQRWEEMGQQAYETLRLEWNVDVAVNRFLVGAMLLLTKGEIPHVKTGPMSPAPIIKNNWYKG